MNSYDVNKRKFITCLSDIPYNSCCAIYGSGNAGKNLYKLITLYRADVDILFFLDSKKSKGKFEGLEIVHYKDFLDRSDNVIVLIASQFWYEIEKNLLECHFSNYLNIPGRFLYDNIFDVIKSEYIKPVDNTCFPLCFDGNENNIITEKLKQVEALLTTENEKKLYRTITCQGLSPRECMLSIIGYYFSKKPGIQYFDYINPAIIKNMIEGGVYNGRETMDFFDNFPEGLCIHGFEPNKQVLVNGDYYKRLLKKNFVHVPKGLWNKEATLFFDICGSSSHLTDKKTDASVEVTSIDHYVKSHDIDNIDFIKLDIEGAELETLEGARNTIEKCRPQLAVCIYHKQSDFYEIPLYLNAILDNYHFHLNHYTATPYESVWYAIPDEAITVRQ